MRSDKKTSIIADCSIRERQRRFTVTIQGADPGKPMVIAGFYAQEAAFGRSFCFWRRPPRYWHALRTRACQPGRASGFSISTSAQSLGSIGLSNVLLSLSAALGGRPSL
jgi:hypothetical protein